MIGKVNINNIGIKDTTIETMIETKIKITKEQKAAFGNICIKKTRKKNAVGIYPGSGNDIVFPFLFMSSLFEVKEWEWHFIDLSINPGSIANAARRLTGHSRIVGNRIIAKGISINCIEGDYREKFPNTEYDFYFERAFEMFRADDGKFLNRAVKNLRKGGIFISDTRVSHPNLGKMCENAELKSLGFYPHLCIYEKY